MNIPEKRLMKTVKNIVYKSCDRIGCNNCVFNVKSISVKGEYFNHCGKVELVYRITELENRQGSIREVDDENY